MATPLPSAAVIDIGSNSIKLLVAARQNDGQLFSLYSRTLDVRISAGISQTPPRLSEPGMHAGLAAVETLLREARHYLPHKQQIVATSAVRDATNGPEFRERILKETGQVVRILSGDEEANLIGRGLLTDTALSALSSFYVFDLGGGSLECLAFEHRRITAAASFPLGCVRLTERFCQDSSLPFSRSEQQGLAQHVHESLQRGAFPFNLPTPAEAIFTGGTITTARATLAENEGLRLESSRSYVSKLSLQQLLDQIAPLPLTERRAIPGIPSARADVFPVGLATLITLADYAQVSGFWHSFHNLRWGIADELLIP
ncbi:MAG TPA: phosphatase [Opitutaceae bacterium]|nr:phosphatase [Opitutaceae bacterium]